LAFRQVIFCLSMFCFRQIGFWLSLKCGPCFWSLTRKWFSLCIMYLYIIVVIKFCLFVVQSCIRNLFICSVYFLVLVVMWSLFFGVKLYLNLSGLLVVFLFIRYSICFSGSLFGVGRDVVPFLLGRKMIVFELIYSSTWYCCQMVPAFFSLQVYLYVIQVDVDVQTSLV